MLSPNYYVNNLLPKSVEDIVFHWERLYFNIVSFIVLEIYLQNFSSSNSWANAVITAPVCRVIGKCSKLYKPCEGIYTEWWCNIWKVMLQGSQMTLQSEFGVFNKINVCSVAKFLIALCLWTHLTCKMSQHNLQWTYSHISVFSWWGVFYSHTLYTHWFLSHCLSLPCIAVCCVELIWLLSCLSCPVMCSGLTHFLSCGV